MKQIIQDIKKGNTILEEVPVPMVKSGHLLVRTTCSLVSLGTERMLVEFGKAGYLEKARQQPDKVKQVLDKMRTDGVLPTVDAVFNKLNQPIPLGYCNTGVVVEIGKGVKGFKSGDRVASNGNHAEYVCVPENLAALIPENVSDEQAVFTVIGSIALEGIRLCNPTFGETIAVIGLGLIGLVTVELLKANGCRVVGFDFDQDKVDLALQKGIKAVNPGEGMDPVKYIQSITNGTGADGVIISASSKGDDILHQAAEMSRARGRIILVGVVGLNIRRDDFYKKELTFQVSCSYGPGRYDENYEQKGHDYPIGYVRWTEKRNFEAVLESISSGIFDPAYLITERIPLAEYSRIYGDMRKKGSIASILVYPEDTPRNHRIMINNNAFKPGKGVFGIIGAGNFTSSTIVPGLKTAGAQIKYISSAGGLSGSILAKKSGIKYSTTDFKDVLNDTEVDSVIISTRHNLHSAMVADSLKAGKNVFVEKPLCLNEDELKEILDTYHSSGNENKNEHPMLVVGFNRRFSPLSKKIKDLLGDGPKNIIATMNAGFIPPDSWVQDIETGGGRIIGEACHYIDLCTFFAGSKIVSVCMNSLGNNPALNTDNASILLKYENGTNAVINYFANGSKAYSKERVEVYYQQKTLILDNWRTLKGYGFKGFSKMRTGLDKGHKNQFRLLNESIQSGTPIIPLNEIVNTTQAGFAAIRSLKENRWVEL